MTNGILEELNENIKKLISIFEVYPNPVDEAQQVKQAPKKKAEPKQEAPQKEEVQETTEAPQKEEVQETTETPEESISDADLQKIIKHINETGEKGKLKEIKAYITKIGSSKVTDVPQEQRAEFVTFLEGLL